MIPDARRLVRATTAACVALATLLAAAAPAAYLFAARQYLVGRLDAQAELSARMVTALVSVNPRTWIFEQVRLGELLERRHLAEERQTRRVLDTRGNLVAESVTPLAAPVVTRSRPIYDAGQPAGRVEISQSLRPAVERALAVGLVTAAAGVGVVFILGVLPYRAIRRALDALQESERRYRLLFESLREGMALFRVMGSGRLGPPAVSLVGANPSLAAMLGVERDALLGTDGTQFMGGALQEHLPEIHRRAREGEGLAFELSLPETGRAFAATVFFPQRSLFALLLEDLTEVRKAEEERERMQSKMLQTQKLESLGILAGGIAHDFNNLLMGVLGNVDLALAKSPPEAEARPYLQRIEVAAQRAAELTNQMLAYSGRGRFVVEPVDLSRLVGEMESLLATVVSKSAEVRYELAAGLPAVEADATQLRQLIMNLITNASDAVGPRGGVIRVSTGVVEADRPYLASARFGDTLPDGPYVYVEVEDTGCGMDLETQARVFDPFFTTKETGRGLGLAAALGIVRGHGGALKLKSEPGGGTTFRVLFRPLEGVQAGPTPGALGEAGPEPGRRRTVLVVDDEEHVRALTVEMLEGWGFSVLTAADGVEGVETFRRHHAEISAVVMDMTMPRMGGEEALREIRKVAPAVPVVLCSGYAEQETLCRLEGGAPAAFVQKPYRAKTLLDTLEEVLRGG